MFACVVDRMDTWERGKIEIDEDKRNNYTKEKDMPLR